MFEMLLSDISLLLISPSEIIFKTCKQEENIIDFFLIL